MARPIRSTQANARIARAWSLGFYVVGVAALGAGLLVGGIVAAATGTAAGLGVAAIIGASGVATGGLGLWESRRFRHRAARLERRVSEQRLLLLAAEHQGVLRVVDVARELGITSREAEAMLDPLVDEVRVSMRVTDEGEIHYVFRELGSSGGPRVRMAAPELAEDTLDSAAEAEMKLKR